QWVEDIGGKLTRDEQAPGKPVVKVELAFNKKATDEGLKNLAELTSLRSLSLYWCGQITDAGMKHVKELTTLETLNLGNTSVTDVGVAELKDLKNLKSLTLSGCIRMTDKSTETINGFADLDDLAMPSTITDRGVKNLVGLRKLKTLYIGGAVLTDAAMKHIAENMPELESLELGAFIGTHISDESVPHFAKLKKLKTLGLSGSRLTKTGLKELQKALPDCTVMRRAEAGDDGR